MKSFRDWGFFIIIGAVAVIAVIVLRGAGGVDEGARTEQVDILRQAVARSAVQCYALEGAYPPDVRYLEEHYGLSIDHDRYIIHYRVDGSNLPPDIDVYPKK